MQTHYEDLTDSGRSVVTVQWQIIKEILNDHRKRKHNLGAIGINGILEILRTGTQWRNLKHLTLSWQIIYYYFRKWRADGTLERLINVSCVKPTTVCQDST